MSISKPMCQRKQTMSVSWCMVGPAEGSSEESFDVIVCTPRWLERCVRQEGPLLGCHHLIMEKYDVARMRIFLTNEIESIKAPTWHELASKIGRIGKWEFEDYHDALSSNAGLLKAQRPTPRLTPMTSATGCCPAAAPTRPCSTTRSTWSWGL